MDFVLTKKMFLFMSIIYVLSKLCVLLTFCSFREDIHYIAVSAVFLNQDKVSLYLIVSKEYIVIYIPRFVKL